MKSNFLLVNQDVAFFYIKLMKLNLHEAVKSLQRLKSNRNNVSLK